MKKLIEIADMNNSAIVFVDGNKIGVQIYSNGDTEPMENEDDILGSPLYDRMFKQTFEDFLDEGKESLCYQEVINYCERIL